jgi:hypothetical protein
VSALRLRCGRIGSRDPHDAFHWLDRYQPVDRVGKSIRLYYFRNAEEEH